MVERAAYKASRKRDLPQHVNRVGQSDRADKPVATDGKKSRWADDKLDEVKTINAIRALTKSGMFRRDEDEMERQRRRNENERRSIGRNIPDVKLRKPVLAGNDR